MSEVMMALGEYRFSLNTAAYQEIKKTQEYRWVSQERIQRRPAQQFVGLGKETIGLSGVIYPHYLGGTNQIQNLKIEAEKGKPLLLTDGLGFVWGQWVVNQITETCSYLQSNGQPLKQTFQIQLTNYGRDN